MPQDNNHKKLRGIPKRDVFSVPEGYFDSLQERIEKRIAQEEEKKIISFRHWKYIGLAAAASIALLIMLLPRILSTENAPATAEELIDEITADDCLTYLRNTDIDTEEILGLMPPDVWTDTMDEDLQFSTPEVTEEDIDLLYERYGVTPDKNLQTL
jgi:hypothetical protein